MTIGGYLAYLLGQRLYYSDRKLLGDSLGVYGNSEVVNILKKVVRYIVIVEIVGIVLLTTNFVLAGYNFVESAWLGTFHAISAFANAGFDIMSDELESSELAKYKKSE